MFLKTQKKDELILPEWLFKELNLKNYIILNH